MYCKTQNDQVVTYPYSPNNLIRENPNVIFPAHLNNAIMAEYGVYLVTEQPDPSYDKKTQKVEKSAKPVLIEGKWVITKTVIDLSEDQISELENGQASLMRSKRNRKLISTDWTQFNDSPLDNTTKQAWATFRQALRDISTHPNWPYLSDEDWPTKPS